MSLRSRLATAFLPPPDEDDGADPLSERGWQATVVGMHVISAALWALAAVTAVTYQDGSRLVAVLAVLAAFALAYLLAGAPALTGNAPVRAVATSRSSSPDSARSASWRRGCSSCCSSPIRRCDSSSTAA